MPAYPMGKMGKIAQGPALKGAPHWLKRLLKIKENRGERKRLRQKVRKNKRISSPKASNGQQFPCPALLSP